MEYFAQGKDDGLCGFNASLNAISWLMKEAGKPLKEAKRRAFFDSAVDCLIEDRRLARDSALRILKGDPDQGGISQKQIAELSQRIASRNDLTISIKLKRNNMGSITFERMFSAEVKSGTNFAMIVATRGGGHWVVAVPCRRIDRFTLIDNARPKGLTLEDGIRKYVAREAIVLELAS